MKDMLRLVTLLLLVLNLVAAHILECRIISSICQDEPTCLTDMQTRFPICFTEQMYKRSWDGYGTDKRAFKLMNILLKVDRIPVGR